MRFIVAILCLLIFPVASFAQSPQVSVIEPRTFGYFLGDKLVREIVIRPPPGASLRAAALPQPGPRDYWLDLVESKLTAIESRTSTEHHLSLTYQVFYAALEPKRVRIPGFKLYFDRPAAAGGDAVDKTSVAPDGSSAELSLTTATVSPLEIIVSPLREIIPEKTDDDAATPLRPDAAASALGTGRARTGLLISALLATAISTALAYHYAWFPFSMRRHRPFARAARKINAQDALSSAFRNESDLYGEELIILHRAFDESFGRRVLSSDIAEFVKQKPEFRPLQDRVEEFYAASDLAFFAGKSSDARRLVSTHAVGYLAHDLALLERQIV